MNCAPFTAQLSEYMDGELETAAAPRLEDHLAGCAACTAALAQMRSISTLLRGLPQMDSGESIAARVLDRLELPGRGPGLSLLFRSARIERPMLMRSVMGAAAAMFLSIGATLLLQEHMRRAEPLPRPVLTGWAGAVAGTEANPFPLLSGVTLPIVTQPFPEPVLESLEPGSLFVETVVARDGRVSEVTLLEGDAAAAGPVLTALREERFQPGSLHGRPVAVSVYRLFSRMDVTPLT